MMRARVLLAIFVVALLASTGGFAKDGDLRPFKRGSWQEIRQAHAGRPTVVHFWGLTCGPCRVEMPQWGKLLRERSDLDLVAIDADLIPNHRAWPLAARAKPCGLWVARFIPRL